MERRFGFTWLPMSFGVPENLPRKLFEEAKVKAENMWADAQEKILVALRMSFLGLVEHAAERLKVEPGEKAKIFKSSTIGNIKEFLEVFSAKNILNDKELEGFVKQAEQVMLDVGDVSEFSESIRDDESMRNSMAQKFEQIKEGVSGMIMSRPARVFDLEVDDES
jgi:hypothetical protein